MSIHPSLKKPILGFMLITLSAFLTTAQAVPAELIQTGRYLTVKNQPLAAQKDLLSINIQVHFTPDIKTVGDAITHLLPFSGYDLVDIKQQSLDLQNTLKKPLPLVDRDLAGMTLRQALLILVGPAFQLKVEPLNRTINFQVKPHHQNTQTQDAL